jgi:hypothetical protein
VQWGFFLGDLVNTDTRRDHIGMGFWVAGRPVTAAQLQTVVGTATYRGGMIGTVVDQTSVRTAVGSFALEHNFAKRQGSLSAAFDGAAWQGVQTSIPQSAASGVFTGSGLSMGTTNRTLSVQGSFFHNTPANVREATAPGGVGGSFAISGGSAYSATGVFVGTQPK